MNAKLFKTIILFALFNLAAFLLILWIVDYSGLNLPAEIPMGHIRTFGILMTLVLIINFIFLQKQLLKINAEFSVFYLVLISTISSFISFLSYQLISEYIISHESFFAGLSYVLIASIMSSILCILVATSVAFELKKIKRIWQNLFTISCLIIFFLAKEYIFSFIPK